MAKCYIRLDKDKNIIHAFSGKFEEPEKKDILIEDSPGRHFNWEHMPLGLTDRKGKYNYKYENNSIIPRPENEKYTQQELDAEEKEKLIQKEMQSIMREQAIEKLKADSKLDDDGNLIKE